MSEYQHKFEDPQNGSYLIKTRKAEITNIQNDLKVGTYVEIRFDEEGNGTLTTLDGDIGIITKTGLKSMIDNDEIEKVG